MIDKVIDLLNKDWSRLTRELSIENDTHKRDMIVGALGYIANLEKEIKSI